MNIQNKCLDCNRKIDQRSTRCSSCFNISRGSWGNHSEETKLKISENKLRAKRISESLKGKPSPNKGKIGRLKHSTEAKKNHSEFMKEWHKIHEHPKGFSGHKRTKEYLQQRSEMFSGEKNPNWQGGKNFEPYGIEFNKKLKKQIRERDNNECILCRLELEKMKENLKSDVYWIKTLLITKFEANMGKKFAIHHIDYNKKNNSVQNLINLCNVHHGKTNANRKVWITFLQELLSKKYDYKSLEVIKNQYPKN